LAAIDGSTAGAQADDDDALAAAVAADALYDKASMDVFQIVLLSHGGRYSMSASASPELGGNRRGNVTRQ